MKIYSKIKNKLKIYIKICYFLAKESMIFFIVNIKGSYEAKKLLNDGYFVWHEKISDDLCKKLVSFISKENYVTVEHHPIDLFNMYKPNDSTIKDFLQKVPEISKVLTEVGCKLKIESNYINITKPNKTRLYSYDWHHDGKLRHYRIIVLLNDASNTNCTHYDSGSNGSFKRFFDFRKTNIYNYSPHNLQLFAWKARSVYLFDTSGWHRSGVPNSNNERPVLNISLKTISNEIVR
tara:strand:+ start:949 stop:1653 length:705 start_codon:yes stop_codon:yes gene_type:complete